jgi:hypothetical protein
MLKNYTKEKLIRVILLKDREIRFLKRKIKILIKKGD